MKDKLQDYTIKNRVLEIILNKSTGGFTENDFKTIQGEISFKEIKDFLYSKHFILFELDQISEEKTFVINNRENIAKQNKLYEERIEFLKAELIGEYEKKKFWNQFKIFTDDKVVTISKWSGVIALIILIIQGIIYLIQKWV